MRRTAGEQLLTPTAVVDYTTGGMASQNFRFKVTTAARRVRILKRSTELFL